MIFEGESTNWHKVLLSVIHTPSWEEFETVTISMRTGGAVIEADVTPEEARRFAAAIIRCCEIVENDKG